MAKSLMDTNVPDSHLNAKKSMEMEKLLEMKNAILTIKMMENILKDVKMEK